MDRELADGKLLLDHPAEAVARLTINNTEKRNALDHTILDAITQACAELGEGISIRCLVLTGREKMFSSGYDIGDIPINSFAGEAERLVAHPFHKAIEAVESFPYPTVAAINGHALGGGLELALACDLRVASAGIKLGMPPAKLGLIYSHTGLKKFIDCVGVPNTKELFFTGEPVSSERGDEIGLVNHVVERESLESATLDLAEGIAANAPLSQKGNKEIIRRLADFERFDEAEEERLIALRRSCFETEDFREGVIAFAEKRKPEWKDK